MSKETNDRKTMDVSASMRCSELRELLAGYPDDLEVYIRGSNLFFLPLTSVVVTDNDGGSNEALCLMNDTDTKAITQEQASALLLQHVNISSWAGRVADLVRKLCKSYDTMRDIAMEILNLTGTKVGCFDFDIYEIPLCWDNQVCIRICPADAIKPMISMYFLVIEPDGEAPYLEVSFDLELDSDDVTFFKKVFPL